MTPSRDAVEAAARRIAGDVRATPRLELDLAGGVALKPERLQLSGSFKARGACNALRAAAWGRRLGPEPGRVRRRTRPARRARIAAHGARVLLPVCGANLAWAGP